MLPRFYEGNEERKRRGEEAQMRVPEPKRAEMTPEGQQAYDAITASRGRVVGPFFPLLHHPPVAEKVAALGEQLRFHGVLPGADRELAILAAGREVEALFEWHAHEPIAVREGTRPEAIAAVKERGSTDGLTAREAIIIETVRALYREHVLTDAHYARAEAELGRTGLVELVVLAGYYGMIGMVLNAFAVDLPQGATPAFAR
jgi:4-carboxymuconolactone decarboxylase